MKTFWIKIKRFFTPYSNDLVDIREKLESEFATKVERKVTQLLGLSNKKVIAHIDRRVDNLLKARAASKDKDVKQGYNGTIKELRTVKDLILED